MQNTPAGRSLGIALLAWDYPPARSGLATAAREVAESLRARGHRVRVLSLDRAADDGDILGAGRFLGESLKALRLRAGTGHLAAPIAFARALDAAQADEPLDLVEATNWYAPAVALGPDVPLVTRCSSPAASTARAGDGPETAFDRLAATALERAQARRSAGLISNTEHHGRAVASLYGVSPPGARHAVIGLSLPPDAPRELPLPPPGPPFRLLFVGRPSRRKGFDALLGAAERLGAAATFRLVGVGPRDAALPANCAPLGGLGEAALAAELEAAHAVLAPSRYESFGLVYQEAIQAGRPLVACAEDPSARRFVGEAGTGTLAERCTAEAVAAAARALLEDPARYEAARAACKVAARRFTRDSLGAETEGFYRLVLQGRNGVSRACSSPRRAVSVAPSDMVP